MWLESRLPDFQTDWMWIVMYCDFDRKDWHVMTHHEMNLPSRMEGLESKAALLGMTFVLVFLGESENSDMTVSGSPPKYANMLLKVCLKMEDLIILLWIFP